MTIIIEKDVPIPPLKRRIKGEIRKTLEEMEIGESFLFPLAKRSALGANTKATRPKRFETRVVDADNVRVWRVK